MVTNFTSQTPQYAMKHLKTDHFMFSVGVSNIKKTDIL